MDSHSLIVKVRVCTRFGEQMLVCCSWFGYVFFTFEQSMCVVLVQQMPVDLASKSTCQLEL